MKKIFIPVLIVNCVFLILSCGGSRALYSPFTSRLIQEIETAEKSAAIQNSELFLNDSICKRFMVTKTETSYTVNSIILVDNSFKIAQLEPFNIKIRSQNDKMYNVTIPVAHLQELGRVSTILRIEIDTPIKQK